MNWFYLSLIVAIGSVALSFPILGGLDESLYNCRYLHHNATLKSLDFNRYFGQWYELYHTSSFYFDHDCVCTTAKYSFNNDKTVSVDNSCYRNGRLVDNIGHAKIAGNASLEVSFGLSFYAPYDIVFIHPNYSYAVVMSCSPVPILGGLNLWILGRDRNGAEDVEEIEDIMDHLRLIGLKSAVDKLVQTNQTYCGSDIIIPYKTNISHFSMDYIYNKNYYIIAQTLPSECYCKRFSFKYDLTQTTYCHKNETNINITLAKLSLITPEDTARGVIILNDNEHYQIVSATDDYNNVLILHNQIDGDYEFYFLSTNQTISKKLFTEYESIAQERGFIYGLQILDTNC